jgi:hypothetical protein
MTIDGSSVCELAVVRGSAESHTLVEADYAAEVVNKVITVVDDHSDIIGGNRRTFFVCDATITADEPYAVVGAGDYLTEV